MMEAIKFLRDAISYKIHIPEGGILQVAQWRSGFGTEVLDRKLPVRVRGLILSQDQSQPEKLCFIHKVNGNSSSSFTSLSPLRSTTFLFVYHVHKEAEKKTRRKHEKKNE
jgi:hypothetical protein